MKSFSQLAADALQDALKSTEGPGAIPRLLAELLRDGLRREGYAIHAEGTCHRVGECDHSLCVRPGPAPEGRTMAEVMAERKES